MGIGNNFPIGDNLVKLKSGKENVIIFAWQNIGCFRGIVSSDFDTPLMRASLEEIVELSGSRDAQLLQAGRHKTIRLSLNNGSETVDAVVKIFGRQSLFKDLCDKINGSKAFRTYKAALHLAENGIGTTTPVACLERWSGFALKESIFVSLYMADTLCCKEMFIDLYKNRPFFQPIHTLIRNMAAGIRRLHDSGFVHGDLGNQNIFFTRPKGSDEYSEALFLDLNRARFSDKPLSLMKRADDLARVHFPSGFYELFLKEYWNGEMPEGFLFKWRLCKALFRLNGKTRKFRHPLRELRYKRNPDKAPSSSSYPKAEEYWIWDEARFRPAKTLTQRDQLRFMSPQYRAFLYERQFAMRLRGSLEPVKRLIPGIKYQKHSVPFRLILSAKAPLSSNLDALEKNKTKRALLRFSYSVSDGDNEAVLLRARALLDHKIDLAIQIVQAPVYARNGFADFVKKIADEFALSLSWLVVGQGINNPDWNIRDGREVKDLLSIGEEIAKTRAKVLSSVVEAPTFQFGSGNISTMFSKSVHYTALALSWNAGDGDFVDEIRSLRALAARTYYVSKKVVVITDEPFTISNETVLTVEDKLFEICAPGR